jgi:hypothetical protein
VMGNKGQSGREEKAKKCRKDGDEGNMWNVVGGGSHIPRSGPGGTSAPYTGNCGAKTGKIKSRAAHPLAGG